MGDDTTLRPGASRDLKSTEIMGPSSIDRMGKMEATPAPALADIGHYRILRQLGEGGMGIVYEAEQAQPRRIVALKVIKPGLATPERLRRFAHESEALGRLQHPGIAQIYEASTADTGYGLQPFFAMELIQGRMLLQYAEARQLNTRQRLELVGRICEAVHHAHQRGLIHRDLKPANILVDETGQPKILDFGVARLTDSDAQATRQTDLGQLVGTLAYMSPEQILADPLELDTRSDVYSLGVILYELLTGRLPYEVNRRHLHEAVQIIREEDPAALGSISRHYRGDIETIVGKALEKDKARRFSSAADLAADIRRYLNDEPITARPASVSYRLQKFASRNKAAVGGAAAVFVMLLVGIIATAWQGRVAIQERNRARDAQRAAEVQQKRAETALNSEAIQRQLATEQARLASQNAIQAEARELLAFAVASLDEVPERSLILGLYSWDKGRQMVGGLEQLLHDAILQSSVRLTLSGHQGQLNSVAWSPDGRKLATTSNDRTAKVWDASTGRVLLTLRGEAAAFNAAWSPDGSKLATASNELAAMVWDAKTGRELSALRGHQNIVFGIAWSPDGSKLATASADQTAKVWQVGTGRELLTLRGHQNQILAVAWSPDGSKLATACVDHTAKVWDSSTGRELLTLRGHQSPVRSIAWSPDGSKLATASDDQTAKVWEAGTGVELLTLRGGVYTVACSQDGHKLATASLDRTATIWDSATGRQLQILRGHQGFIKSVAWSPDGSKLATASDDKTAAVWEAGGHELLSLRSVGAVSWSADGRTLAAASDNYTVREWEAQTGRELHSLRVDKDSVYDIAWSPDGSRLATASNDKTPKVWNVGTGREVLTLRGHQNSVTGIAWSPDGRKLATASLDQTARVWDGGSGRELLILRSQTRLTSIEWSPDGRKLATTGLERTNEVNYEAAVWEASTGRRLLTLRGARSDIAWSPDASKLAAPVEEGAKIWDASTGRGLLTLTSHQLAVYSVAWSPHGSMLATAGFDQTAKVWAASTGRELLTLRGHQAPVSSVAWSPDGSKLATGGGDQTVQVYAIDPVQLLRLVRSRITRALTADECRHYLNTDHCPPLPTVP
jgi:WD40 repeat protein/tRNA A-37 threonylcarbamoyl transferase component Bud32